jgi:hypothetical protein
MKKIIGAILIIIVLMSCDRNRNKYSFIFDSNLLLSIPILTNYDVFLVLKLNTQK